MIAQLNIIATSGEQVVNKLSGGNQQKVVVGKWLASKPRLLIVDEPTRGVDVGAKAEIHRLMSELAQQGLGILMISSELPEVLGMSDRILVMRQGHLVAEFSRAEANQHNVGRGDDERPARRSTRHAGARRRAAGGGRDERRRPGQGRARATASSAPSAGCWARRRGCS